MNYYSITFDLYTPGQKYNELIKEIEKAPTNGYVKTMLSGHSCDACVVFAINPVDRMAAARRNPAQHRGASSKGSL